MYPATRYALRGEVAAQWCEKLVPESKNSGWLFPDDLLQKLLLELGVGTVGYTYSLVIEVPIALVADTVLLPLDIRRMRTFDTGEDVFADALIGKWILRDVSLHPAATDETLMLILETCDALDRHPAARDAKDVIDEARKTASERINREQQYP